ncbi:MAG: SulP family inorganic anion transporter [Parachlamydiaceae bacterium]|nr:SulP family inorganic anion transporter [Parachlamydiaceae bacterium]
MPLTYPADDISLAPLQDDINSYNWITFSQDLMAGLSVALLTLPQAMAYALLAGLPLSAGLFAAIYSSIIAALFGSSRQLVMGPSNAIAILIQSGTAEILYTYYRDLTGVERDIMAVQILTQLTFLTATLQILAAWCRLGRLTQFVSHSVVIGYIAGTACAVIISQLFILLNIPRLPGVHSLYENTVYLVTHLNEVHWLTTTLGIGSLTMLLMFKRINVKVPAAVITFAVAAIIVEMLGLSSYSGSSLIADLHDDGEFSLPNVLVVGDTGEVYDVIPQLSLPFFNMRIINGILPVAFAIALLSVIDSTSVAKSIASSTGQHLSNNQEIFGLGLGNMVSAFINGMPISGSPSRSAINFSNGAKTRFAAIFNALFVAFFIFVLGFFITRIPLATMSALVLVTATGIVNIRQLLFCARATPSDAFVLWTTLLACMFFSLDIAFYVGVILSITLYLKKAAVIRLAEYDIDDAGELKDVDPTKAPAHKAIRVIKIEGELFFGSADLFQTTLKTITEDDTSTRVIILQLKNARDIDATTCLALQQLHSYLINSGHFLIACGITEHIWEVLSSSGLIEQIGRENLFMFDSKHPHHHMQEAIRWAKTLVSIEPKVDEVAAEAAAEGIISISASQ